MCQMHPREGVQVLFGHQKQWSPPLESGLPWVLKCLITNQSTIAVVIKNSKNRVTLCNTHKREQKKEPTKWFLKVSSHGTQQAEKKQPKRRAKKVVFKKFPNPNFNCAHVAQLMHHLFELANYHTPTGQESFYHMSKFNCGTYTII